MNVECPKCGRYMETHKPKNPIARILNVNYCLRKSRINEDFVQYCTGCRQCRKVSVFRRPSNLEVREIHYGTMFTPLED